MQEFSYEVRIKLLTSTRYYAQANGQLKAANKVIIGIIKNHVGKSPRNWHMTLDRVLWVCRKLRYFFLLVVFFFLDLTSIG